MCSEKDEEVQERDEFRKDRAKERQRERNIARAAPDKRLVEITEKPFSISHFANESNLFRSQLDSSSYDCL